MKKIEMLVIAMGAALLIGVARADDRSAGIVATAAPLYLAANDFSISIMDENDDLDSFTKRIDIEDEDGLEHRDQGMHVRVRVGSGDEYEDSPDNHEDARDDAVDHEGDVVDDSKKEVDGTHEGGP